MFRIGLSLPARRWGVLVACIVVACVAVAASSAMATEFGSEGPDAGQLFDPQGVAVANTSGSFYVVDHGNQRVDEFSSSGAFQRAWGWGVLDGAEKLETCTTSCRAGNAGAGAGQLRFATGIAVSNATPLEADVYVMDRQNDRVEKFGPEGEFLLMFGADVNKTKTKEAAPESERDLCTAAQVQAGEECGAGVEGFGAGQFSEREFKLAVGPSGDVYVGGKAAGGEGRVQRFSPGGAYLETLTVAAGVVGDVAVGPGADIYVTIETSSGPKAEVLEYEGLPGGKLLRTITLPVSIISPHPQAVAIAADGHGNLLVGERYQYFNEVSQHLLEYDSAGAETESFPPPAGEAEYLNGIAVDESGVNEEVAVVGHSSVMTTPVPAPGPLVSAESATARPGEKATLEATVNPEGHETKYWFEYGPAGGSQTRSSTGTISKAKAEAFADEHVSIRVSGLTPKTVYDYRVVAEDSEGHRAEGAQRSFEALPAVGVEDLAVTEVTATSAKLEAEVDPLGTASSYIFEYGTGGKTSRTAPIAVGSGELPVYVSVLEQGLTPASVYTYRILAENPLGHEEESGTFVTQLAVAPPLLPDGREWELVSPALKRGAGFEAAAREGAAIQAAANGEAITYVSRASTEAQPDGEPTPEWAQILSRHESGGWASADISTPHEGAWGIRTGELSEYRLFSEDLSLAVVEPGGFTPLSPQTTERTPYLRTSADCGAGKSGCFTPLVTGGMAQPEVPTGTKFGGSNPRENPVRVLGGTANLEHIVLRSEELPLTTTAQPGQSLYEWTAGHLGLVSVLPDGATPAGCDVWLGAPEGYLAADERNAVSPNGARVVWQTGGCNDEVHIYLRDVAREETVMLDEVQPKATGANRATAVYQDANAAGTQVLFTDTQRLTEDSRATEAAPDLYEWDEGKLTDLTVPVNAGESADVRGAVIGAAQDGSKIYFVARGVLSAAPSAGGSAAVPGEPNLYLMSRTAAGWQTTFIATLSAADSADWGQPHSEEEHQANDLGTELGRMTARVSPNGQWLTFMSEAPLTGYDNRDAVSGKRDEEVFLYDAASGRLACASCNPSGARPHGVLDQVEGEPAESGVGGGGEGPLVDRVENWNGHWIAAILPAWRTLVTGQGVSTYQPRYLSDSGRLFFESPASLVSQATNHVEDVYEYEPAGTGGCAAGGGTYSPVSGGCVNLISSGTSTKESAFLDASESGNDVFFLTAAKLVAEDKDTAYDVYDAHVCGSGWACATAQPSTAARCETAAECKAAVGAGAAALGAPASLVPSGVGNLVPQPKSAAKESANKAKRAGKKRRAARRRRKLKQALAHCRRAYRHSRHRRRLCSRRARRRFGAHAGRRRRHHHHVHRHRRGR